MLRHATLTVISSAIPFGFAASPYIKSIGTAQAAEPIDIQAWLHQALPMMYVS